MRRRQLDQMTVQEIFAGGKLYPVTGTGYEPKGDLRFDRAVVKVSEHPALAECLRAGVLCNDSQLARDEHGRLKVQGDPTEAALLVAAEKRRGDSRRHASRLATRGHDSLRV